MTRTGKHVWGGIGASFALVALGAVLLAVAAPIQRTMGSPALTLFSGPSMERDSIVSAAAKQAGMPVPLAIAVSHVENWSGDSMAKHPVSGAVGLMQILPRAWSDSFVSECGADSLVVRMRNACVGTHVAVRYFELCGNWDCALRMYAGAWCTKTDSWERCNRKSKAGDAYILGVMQRLYRTDLSPARDQMALGTSWRRDVSMVR